MIALIAANAEIAEEVELGRTLLGQGHLDTAQRVLVKVCREQPECAEAFRVLSKVLSKRGDDKRARPLLEYADELDSQRTREIPAGTDDVFSEADTGPNRLPAVAAPPAIPLPRPPALPVVPAPLVQSVSAAASSASSLPTATPPGPVVPPSWPVAAPVPAPPVAVLTLPTVSAPMAQPPRKSRRGRYVALLIFAAALAGGAFVANKHYGELLHYGRLLRHGKLFSFLSAARTKPPNPREELDRSLAAGSLDLLMRARDVARVALETSAPDADALARLGLVNALLVDDYGIEARKDAELALQRAENGAEAKKERTSMVATARALLAHAAGESAAGKVYADSALAVVAPETPAFALLASARLSKQAGDEEGSSRALDKAITVAPDTALVVVDWAVSRLDGGDPVAARRALATIVERNPGQSLALLALADAERGLGEPTWSKSVEEACRNDAKISQRVRALCAVEAAMLARLEGDRAGAARKARAVSQTTEDPQVLGQAALVLALLGDIDGAASVLERAGKAADPSGAALGWADLAIRLGRGEQVEPAPRFEHPAGPERDLVALRAAYARTGGPGVAELLKQLPPGIQDIDWDVRAFAALARDGMPPKAEMAALERRADRSAPAISYVLGLLAIRDKDFKTAARRLEKGLAWHGDACRAAGLYLDAVNNVGRGVTLNKAALRNLHARNAKCPVPEM
jgi:tetratricopeptide (TPR) repeat protein